MYVIYNSHNFKVFKQEVNAWLIKGCCCWQLANSYPIRRLAQLTHYTYRQVTLWGKFVIKTFILWCDLGIYL